MHFHIFKYFDGDVLYLNITFLTISLQSSKEKNSKIKNRWPKIEHDIQNSFFEGFVYLLVHPVVASCNSNTSGHWKQNTTPLWFLTKKIIVPLYTYLGIKVTFSATIFLLNRKRYFFCKVIARKIGDCARAAITFLASRLFWAPKQQPVFSKVGPEMTSGSAVLL